MKNNHSYSSRELSLDRFARELKSRNVAVWREAESDWYQIPVALSPTVVESEVWALLRHDARMILEAFPKVMSWLIARSQQDPDVSKFFTRLLIDLSPCEVRAARRDPFDNWSHSTIRFDLFWHHGQIKIIEANCTIPAMQSYSDNVLEAWLAAGGSAPSQPRNVEELLKSLLWLYRLHGGLTVRPSIAILHRSGDSQIGELQWLRERWTNLGFQTVLTTPDNLSRQGDFWMADGTACEIVYRHIFASKLEDNQLIDYLEKFSIHQIYNPISAHYESKAFFAVLSFVASDEQARAQIGLSQQQAEAIERRLPWSRIIGGAMAAVSADNVERRLSELVLKRSVGYGGHHVLMGDSWYSNETQSQVKKIVGSESTVEVAAFLQWVQNDSSLWVVQERMSGQKRTTQVLTVKGLETWDAWFDASIFLNSSEREICKGGVSRVAQRPIVNIGAGGGLAPFIII